MFFAKVLLLASLSLSVNALYTPIAARSPHQHRGLAARVAAAAPEAPSPIVRVTPRKRAVKRCKGSSAPIPTPTESPSSSTPTPSQAPVNAGNAPPVFSSAPAPPPSPSPSPSPTSKKSTPAPAPTPSKASGGSTSGGGDGQTHSGDGTFYATGLGACGIVNQDTDFIAAIAHEFYDSYGGGNPNPNNAPICNKKVKATYQGNSVVVTLTDRCGGCVGEALDFSPSAFQQLAPLAVGRIHDVEWVFL